MEPAPPAVFLSYASQDAEAVQPIVDALRAAGIEVWFDQSELRGADAWDQKIRKQIRECALFIPVITANTNTRGEGYFRLEWKLAVDRSHLMADDEPFIFPVVAGDFADSAARVPDRFREVQWARLGTKDTPESIAARVARLLEQPGVVSDRAHAPKAKRRVRKGYVWAIIGITVGLSFATRPLWYSKRESKPPAAATAPVADSTQLAQRALDVTRSLTYTRDHLAVAADNARRATELDPSLALAWGARARVEATWLLRNWDASEGRRRAAQEFAKRALAIDPDEPNALLSHGYVLRLQRALPEAASLMERALKSSPDDNSIRRTLSGIYGQQGREDESRALIEEALARDPRDPLNHVAIALAPGSSGRLGYNDMAGVDTALAHLDRSIEIHPISNAVLWKAIYQAAFKDDLPGAQATLQRLAKLPHEDSAEDRALFVRMWVALLAREPARALEVAALTTTPYIADRLVEGPVAWMRALANGQLGRENEAAEEWRAAERVLRGRLDAQPDSLHTQAELAVTLAMLGRKAEAQKQFVRFEAAMRERGVPTLLPVRFHAAMGDAKRTAAAVREQRKTSSIFVTNPVLARDPWFDRVRGQPEFKALLRELAAQR